MAQSRIPQYGSWNDGDSNGNGFTIQFEKARTFKTAGPIITRNDLNRTEPPTNQDLGPTPASETTPPAAKARPDSEAREADDGVPSKPQEVKIDELTAKKPTLRPGQSGKPRRKLPPDLTPPIPEFADLSESKDYTDIFNRIQWGDVEQNPTPHTPEKPKARKKGGFCGCCFARRKF